MLLDKTDPVGRWEKPTYRMPVQVRSWSADETSGRLVTVQQRGTVWAGLHVDCVVSLGARPTWGKRTTFRGYITVVETVAKSGFGGKNLFWREHTDFRPWKMTTGEIELGSDQESTATLGLKSG